MPHFPPPGADPRVKGDLRVARVGNGRLTFVEETAGDLEAVIAYPCALGALMAMVHDRVPGQVADSLFTAAIGAAGAGFVTWVLVGQAVSHSGTTSTLLVVTALAFPVLDLLMVAV